jgi:hypothetical protein
MPFQLLTSIIAIRPAAATAKSLPPARRMNYGALFQL